MKDSLFTFRERTVTNIRDHKNQYILEFCMKTHLWHDCKLSQHQAFMQNPIQENLKYGIKYQPINAAIKSQQPSTVELGDSNIHYYWPVHKNHTYKMLYFPTTNKCCWQLKKCNVLATSLILVWKKTWFHELSALLLHF